MNTLFRTGFAIAMSASFLSANFVNIRHDDGNTITQIEDITDKIPEISIGVNNDISNANWELLPDVAQYKAADWSTCAGIAHNVTEVEAKAIADSNSEISFFFYVKGGCMILENTQTVPNYVRIFRHGDAVFFKGSPELFAVWGTAPDLADGYVKR